jgi:hypothetical protein
MRAQSIVPNIILSPKGLNYKIETLDSKQSHDWALKAGEKFGVTTDGNLYAINGKFIGDVEANSGKIGGWKINEDYLGTMSS